MDTQKERQRGGQGIEIKFTPDYEAGKPVFIRIFGELSNEGNGLLHYNKLQERFVSTMLEN